MTSFPTELDVLTNPGAADALDAPTVPHAAQHANANDAIEALEAKVGIDGSEVPASLDFRLAALEVAILATRLPVGSLFLAVVSTNPAALLGYGTWAAIATGRVLVGVDAGDADFDAAEKTGGAKEITLTTNQIPAHTHLTQRYPTTTGGSSGFTADTSMSGTPTNNTLPTASAGGGQAHSNVQPFCCCFIWKRTA